MQALGAPRSRGGMRGARSGKVEMARARHWPYVTSPGGHPWATQSGAPIRADHARGSRAASSTTPGAAGVISFNLDLGRFGAPALEGPLPEASSRTPSLLSGRVEPRPSPASITTTCTPTWTPSFGPDSAR